MSYRIDRVNETIKNELSTLIEFELKDPRLHEVMVSVVRTKTTPDLKYCQVYVSVFGDESMKGQVVEILDRAKGFLRKKIAHSLTTRTAPELVFLLDDSMEYAMHIDEVLKEINQGNDKE